MNHLPFLITAVSLLSVTAQAATPGPSFDCAAANRPAEKAICADAKLAALDAEIAALYKTAQAKAGPAAEALKIEQRRWLQGRDGLFVQDGRVLDTQGQIGVAKNSLPGWLTARRAALSVLASQKAPLPICERVAATFRILRNANGGIPDGTLEDRLRTAGLLFEPAPEKPLSTGQVAQMFRMARELRDEIGSDDGHVDVIGKNYAIAQIYVTGKASEACTNFIVFQRGADGGLQALPLPDGTEDGFCDYGLHDNGFDMLTLAGDAANHPALVTWNKESLSIRQAEGAQWGDTCDIDVTYAKDYSLTISACDVDEASCQALKKHAVEWSRIFGEPEPDTPGPGPGHRFPGLEATAIQVDETMMHNPVLNAFPSLEGWSYSQVEGGPHYLWRGPKEALVVGISALTTSHGDPIDDLLISVWRQAGEKWVPAAALITSPEDVGAPTVKAAVTPAQMLKP
ncbi:MAG: lysozyme inhibitor LprI family protein [Azospirillaceae bacterium]|nr:lysozyme inhibitor LprI family protein [Azospirillaceae bacterium]